LWVRWNQSPKSTQPSGCNKRRHSNWQINNGIKYKYAYHDGKRWQQEPFSGDSAKTAQALSLWHQLGLIQTPDPDSCLATRRTTANDHTVTVQLQNGVLRLLAASSEMAQVKSAYQPDL